MEQAAVPAARLHEHGRDDRRRARRAAAPRSDTLVQFEHLFGHYKRSKYLAEHEVLRAGAGGLPVVLVHPTFPVGEGDSAPTPTGRTILEFLNGRIPAYVDTALNVVHVDDVARGHVLAAQRGGRAAATSSAARTCRCSRCSRTLADLCGLKAPRVRLSARAVLPIVRTAEWFQSTVLRSEPVLPSEPVRMATTRMEYDDSRARTELGYTSIPARDGAGACGKLVRRPRLRQRLADGAHPPRRQARNRDRPADRDRAAPSAGRARPEVRPP